MLSKQQSAWAEYKIEGKNIPTRSYACIGLHNNILYVYGGYQLSLGVLGSFYSLDLSEQLLRWNLIEVEGDPGQITRASTFIYQDSLYIQGGLQNGSKQTNLTRKFDLIGQKWYTMDVNESYPQVGFDNHASALIEEQGRVAIYGGYFNGRLSDSLYFYDIQNNGWTKFRISNSPCGREGCSMVYLNDRLYVFGGTDGINKMNDLWQFDLIKNQWQVIQLKNQSQPMVRNGQSLVVWQDSLILFGGIHDITQELDDLWEFNDNEWNLIEIDSITGIDVAQAHKQEKTIEKEIEKSSPQRNSHKASIRLSQSPFRSLLLQKSSGPKNKSPKLINGIENESDHSLLKNNRQHSLEDQKRKELELKKIEMLKQFEVSENQIDELKSRSPTSELMRNALILIGNPSQNKQKITKLTDFGKNSISKFMEPLKNASNLMQGKRPCARDGHRSLVYQDHLIVFGGDRHQMSFNDIYSFDLNSLK